VKLRRTSELALGTYDYLIRLEFVRVGLEALQAKSFESTVGALDLDPDLAISGLAATRPLLHLDQQTHFTILLPDLCMLPNQNFGVKVSIPFGRYRLCVCMPGGYFLERKGCDSERDCGETGNTSMDKGAGKVG
jgi:hypothetical protein